jgi:biofilm PGA synthesis N-glycosyltransferase PgaC
MPTCAVGVMAYDEEFTIGEALRSLLAQEVVSAEITAVVVVSSGSRDGTERIVREIAATDPRVHLLTEPERCGKIAADNLFFERFPADLHALCNADVILAPGALEKLIAPLRDPQVGIVGARVYPRVRTGRQRGFFDFANHLLWELHHRVVIAHPKMGEAVAFRPLVPRIPEEAVADEAYLEAIAHTRGFRVVYAADAAVSAGCPLNLVDFFKVRRRNAAAHEGLHRTLGHDVATFSAAPILRALRAMIRDRLRRARLVDIGRLLRDGAWMVAVAGLEAAARAAGTRDARADPYRHRRWHMARSARRPRTDAHPHHAATIELEPRA